MLMLLVDTTAQWYQCGLSYPDLATPLPYMTLRLRQTDLVDMRDSSKLLFGPQETLIRCVLTN